MKTYNNPKIIEDITSHDNDRKKSWTKRVNEKMERIKGEGYAKRQIEDTLSKVEKIRTEL